MNIQPLFLTDTLQSIREMFDYALINVGGELKEYPIFQSEIKESYLRVYVYIPDDEMIGKQILGASLMKNDGNTYVTESLNAVKSDKGFLVAFEFLLEVKVKANGI